MEQRSTTFGHSKEFRFKDPTTGAEKGVKLARMDLIPPIPHWEVGEHFGLGSRKYSDNNWRKGYPWSISMAALERHWLLFKAGEDFDDHEPDCPPDCVVHTGSAHIIAVMWHCYVLREFMLLHPGKDDRFKQTLEQVRKLDAMLLAAQKKLDTTLTQETQS